MKKWFVLVLLSTLSLYGLDTKLWNNYKKAYSAYLKNKTDENAEKLYELYQDIINAPIQSSQISGARETVASSWQKQVRVHLEQDLRNDPLIAKRFCWGETLDLEDAKKEVEQLTKDKEKLEERITALEDENKRLHEKLATPVIKADKKIELTADAAKIA